MTRSAKARKILAEMEEESRIASDPRVHEISSRIIALRTERLRISANCLGAVYISTDVAEAYIPFMKIVRRHAPRTADFYMFGFPVRVDKTLPHDTVEARWQ
jgi:hypothetical protein